MFVSVKVNPLFARDLELYICSTTGIFTNVKLTRVKLLHIYILSSSVKIQSSISSMKFVNATYQ